MGEKEESKEPSSLGQYCEISTCMGVTDWYLAKPVLGRFFWANLVVVGLAVTIWQTHATIMEFVNASEFKISVSKETQSKGIQFPFITVCNFNRAKQSVINETKLDPRVLSAIFQLFPASYDLPLSYEPREVVDKYEQAFEEYFAKNERDFRKFFLKYGHSRSNSVINLSLGNSLLLQSNSSLYTDVFTVYGLCTRIDVNNTQSIPGSFAGVKLMLNPQLHEYMTNVLFNNYYQQGFAVLLSYHDEPIMSDALLLAPGTVSSIVIKATRNSIEDNDYPIRKKPCQKDATLKILKAPYTPQNCIFDCYMQATLKKCGCVLIVETKLDYPVCNISMGMHCADSNPSDTNESGAWDEKIGANIVGCAANCRNPCDNFMTVEAIMSTTKQKITDRNEGIKTVKRLMPKDTPETVVEQAIDNNVLAKIYFATRDMSIVETGETMPVMTFIGNIGGQLGLWMGISMFSIIQFLYYLSLGLINGELCCKSKKIKQSQAIQIDPNQK